jgi:hypothetical protein
MRLTITKLFPLLIVAVFFSSCKKNIVIGDVALNTFRPIVEFSEPGFVSVAMDYTTTEVTADVIDIRFMIRSDVKAGATAKVIITPAVIADYNTENGTSYTAVPLTKYSLVTDQFSLSPTERNHPVQIKIKPSDVAAGQNAIGLSIAEVNGAEVSRIAGTIVIALSVKNKYDGVYHLKGFFTRTDNPALNAPFDTEVEMITTGVNSVAMYWPFGGDYYQPFTNNGAPAGFTNVAPEVFFNGSDQVSSINNYTGDPAAGPFMTVVAGSNSRFVGGATPVIYLKYYYNTVPTNRIFADTLTYIGSR